MRNKSEARPQNIYFFHRFEKPEPKIFYVFFLKFHSIPTTWSIPWDIQLIITYDSSLTKINKLNRSVRSPSVDFLFEVCPSLKGHFLQET